jgi:hypothetical protein
LAKVKNSEIAIIEVAMGKKNNSLISESEAKEIKELFQDILET